MNVPAKLAVFAATVAVISAGAFAVGAVTNPIAPGQHTVHLGVADDSSEDGGHGGMEGTPGDPSSALPAASAPAIGRVSIGLPGLGVSDRGYSLHLGDTIPGQGNAVGITFPTAGTYRLYLNFSHAGTVRTAEFTVEIPASRPVASAIADPAAPASPTSATPPAAGEHSGH